MSTSRWASDAVRRKLAVGSLAPGQFSEARAGRLVAVGGGIARASSAVCGGYWVPGRVAARDHDDRVARLAGGFLVYAADDRTCRQVAMDAVGVAQVA